MTLVPNGTRVSNIETDNTYTLGKISIDGKIPSPNDFEKLFIIVKNGVAGGGIRTLQLAIRQLPEYVSKRGLVS